MPRQDAPLSGLRGARKPLSGDDLILLSQTISGNLKSTYGTLADLLQYLFVNNPYTNTIISDLGYLKEVAIGELLEGNGKVEDPLNIKLSSGVGNLLQSRSDGLYYGIPNGSITEEKIANNAVSTDKIAAGAVSTDKIAAGAVTDSKIASVSASKITGVISSTNLPPASAIVIPNGSVTEEKIAAAAVTTSKIAAGAVSTDKIATGAVTDSKIQSVSASKITGVIPSANLPPASATVNVIDNLSSNSVNDALSANQGRVLAGQLASKFNNIGGTITGPTTINSGENSVSLNMDGVLHIGYQLLFRRRSTSETEFSIGSGNTSVVMIAHDRQQIFEAKDYTYLDSEDGWLHHTANTGKGKYKFETNCNVFEFNKLVYMGDNTYNRATNGYSYLPNGMLMQWGRYDTQVVEGGINITFPIAFPNACLNVTATRMASDANTTDADGGVYYVSSTTNEAVFNLQGFYGNSKGSLRGFTWVAIGY